MKTYSILNKFKIAELSEDDIFSDVLERIEGYENFVNGINNEKETKIYSIRVLAQILEDEEDDTNETTKLRIEELYEQIKEYDYFMIEND